MDFASPSLYNFVGYPTLLTKRKAVWSLKQMNYSYVIDSKPENLAAIRNYFKDIATAYDIIETDAYDILISLGEAATNAIEHGGGGAVEVDFSLTDDTMTISITSRGAFVKRLPLAEEDNFRGRGILLMLALMDQVSIDEQEDSVTVVMRKRFHRAA